MGFILEHLLQVFIFKANFPPPGASSLSSTPRFSEAAGVRVEITQK